MDRKFGIALVALIGIGIFALPSTIALFTGQHSFYNIDATGNQVPCVKCHGDVKAELGSNYVAAASPGPHAGFKCEYCHRAESGYSAGDDAYAKIMYKDSSGAETLALVTTLQNFERGNFPKRINVPAGGVTVDTWETACTGTCVFAWDGVTPFVNVTAYSSYDRKYDGKLSTAPAVGWYNYSQTSEKATSMVSTAAFNARAATFTGTTTTESVAAAGAREVTPGTRYHAASLVSCMECHGGELARGVQGYTINTSKPYNHATFVTGTVCADCHYGTAPGNNFEVNLEAGGFGLTGYANDTGEAEAHNEFVKSTATAVGGGYILRSSDEWGGYGASNIACVACHTHVAVDINFQKKYKVKFDANATGTGTWDVGKYTAEGVVNITIFGNSEGDVFATSNKSYGWSPGTPTMYINGTGEPIVGLQSEENDTKAALIS